MKIADAEEQVTACLLILLVKDDDEHDTKRREKKTRPWIRKRERKGTFTNVINMIYELRAEDTNTYKEYG